MTFFSLTSSNWGPIMNACYEHPIKAAPSPVSFDKNPANKDIPFIPTLRARRELFEAGIDVKTLMKQAFKETINET